MTTSADVLTAFNALIEAENRFNQAPADNPSLVDAAILELAAAERRINGLLHDAKLGNIAMLRNHPAIAMSRQVRGPFMATDAIAASGTRSPLGVVGR